MFTSIRLLAFVCLVGLSMTFQADAACGDKGHAQFNAVGTTFRQGVYGELYCAVKCILHGKNCVTNRFGAEVYPAEARGTYAGDTSRLVAYYGDDISHWCVGLVKDFSYIFESEVSIV
jgi:hypothetical protein